MKLLPACFRDMPTVWYWLTEAATVFLNGFLSGLPGGSLAGGTTSLATAGASHLTDTQKLEYAVAAAAVAALANGYKRFVVWHDTNPFPNPFPKPETPTSP